MISKNEHLKLSMQALVKSFPAVVTLWIIVDIVLFIFAVIGINLLKGKSFYCNTDDVIGLNEKEIEDLIDTDIDCANYGGVWSKYHYNFDDI